MGSPILSPADCELIFRAALKAGDAKGVEAALRVMALQDPHRAQELLGLLHVALVLASPPAQKKATPVAESGNDARFGIAVDSDNGVHVRLRLFAASGGQHLGGCGPLVMRIDEYAAFRKLLEPRLTDRSDAVDTSPASGGAS